MNASHLASPKTFVLVDPTSPDGEAGLDLLEVDDVHVSLLVLLSGRCSTALHDYAASEEIDMATAGSIYVDQVADRLMRRGDRSIETIVVSGPSPSSEIAHQVATNETRRVILPPSLARVHRAEFDAVVERFGDLVVTPSSLVA